jgi:cytochrome c-type biogenesis protein
MPAADYALAFSAGAISFVSPCVLPLVPVYLSVTSGLGVTDLAQPSRQTAVAVTRGASLFILGFSAVFVMLGLSATALGGLLLRHQAPITRMAGVVVLVLAAGMLFGTTTRGLWMSREWRFHPGGLGRRQAWAPPVTGAAFAFGWTPCIGPVLGSVLAIAATQEGVLRGGALLATYSAGLAVPLLLAGLVFHRAVGPMGWSRRHARAVTRTMATVLALYGILLLSDRLAWLTLTLQNASG